MFYLSHPIKLDLLRFFTVTTGHLFYLSHPVAKFSEKITLQFNLAFVTGCRHLDLHLPSIKIKTVDGQYLSVQLLDMRCDVILPPKSAL